MTRCYQRRSTEVHWALPTHENHDATFMMILYRRVSRAWNIGRGGNFRPSTDSRLKERHHEVGNSASD
jgi:hypothetical protein